MLHLLQSAQISGLLVKRVIGNDPLEKKDDQNYFWILGTSTFVLMISILRIG